VSSPTQRTLAECKRRGWTAQVVERRVPFHHTTIDLFGCIDIVALLPGGIAGIQTCAGASHAARRTKSLAEPRLALWLARGGKFSIWSWSKRGARGKRKVWTLREEWLGDPPVHLPGSASCGCGKCPTAPTPIKQDA
jgi:hypothetical protein